MMKLFISLIIGLFAITSVTQAQNSKLDGPFIKKKVIKVYGKCELCKSRIERAAKQSSGVTYAHWDVDTQQLLVEYNRAKTDPEKIQHSIAARGFDTEQVKATAQAEARLPECCH